MNQIWQNFKNSWMLVIGMSMFITFFPHDVYCCCFFFFNYWFVCIPGTQLDFIPFFFSSTKLSSHWCWLLSVIAGLCFAGSGCISGFLGSPIQRPDLPCLALSLATGSKDCWWLWSSPQPRREPAGSLTLPVTCYHHTVNPWRAETLLDTSG